MKKLKVMTVVGTRPEIIRLSREKYTNSKVVVEDKIMRWSKGAEVDENILEA